MNNISHLHEKLGRVIGFHYEYDHITMRCDHHAQYQLMDSGCRLRARTVGRRQQRAPAAWESRTSFAPPAFSTFFASPAFYTFKPFCHYGCTVLASQTDTKKVNIVYSTPPESIYVNRMFQ